MARTLNARIGASSIYPNEYLEIIQGEEKELTFIVESDDGFVDSTPTTITAKFEDPEGNKVTISNGSVVRVCEDSYVQVIRLTLSPANTNTLVGGVIKIELSFDSQKAILTHSMKVVERIQ